jgi:hypothetical protein
VVAQIHKVGSHSINMGKRSELAADQTPGLTMEGRMVNRHP